MSSSRKILVTGATGSIGKELVGALCAKQYDVAVLVRDALKAGGVFAGQTLEIIDLQDAEWANKVAVFSPEVVVHLASMLTSRDDLDVIPGLIASNITFGAQLLQALRPGAVKLFINTGSFAEYFYGDGQLNPAYLYSATKTAFHSIVSYYQQLSGFAVANIIPYTVYGQFDTQPKAIDLIYRSFSDASPLNMSGGEQTLDFIHISDVVDFYCALIERSDSPQTHWSDYHLGTGQGVTLRQIAQLMSAKLDKPENINWGALPYRARDTMYSVAPIARIINYFGWRPVVNIDAGIDRFLLLKQDAKISNQA